MAGPYASEAPPGAPGLPVDPHLLGVLIGAGSFREHVGLHAADPAFAEVVRGRLPDGLALRASKRRGRYSVVPAGGREPGRSPARPNALLGLLRGLGLGGLRGHERFVPDAYTAAPAPDRLELLRGLCDANGHAESGAATFTTGSARLAAQVRELALSLGATVTCATAQRSYWSAGESGADRRPGRPEHRVRVRMPAGSPPFRLPRKAEVYAAPPRPRARRRQSAAPAGEKDCRAAGPAR